MADGNSKSRALDRQALGAFLLYLAVSFLFFGRGLVGHFSTWYIGRGPDSPAFIWYLAWWAYAATHHVDPFLTKLLFAPVGVNLAWATTVPLAGWLSAPITCAFGPVVTYNVLSLLAPALAGWAAFVLCRWITGSYWPSIAGGWVFGFSSYLVSALSTHLHDTLVFPVPLAVWLVLRRLNGELTARRFIAALGILIAVQFLLFPEIAASASFIGAVAFTLALAFTGDSTRRSVWGLVPQFAAAYAVAAILISPYLYYMFAFGHPAESVFDPTLLGADLLSFIVPTAINELGQPAFFGAISRTYKATLTETGSYIALPLVAISILFAKARFREPVGRLLIELMLIVCLLALGKRLVIGGHPTLAAPWTVVLHVPLLNKVVPVRLMVYAFLALAMIVAMWLSSEARPSRKWVLGVALVPFMLPNISARFWTVPFDIPPFFSTGLYRQYLAPDENVMVLSNPIYGDGLQYQIATGMYFRLAGGYIGISPIAPPEYGRWPIMAALYDVAGVPDAGEQLKALLAHEQVAAVIVSPLKYRFTEQYDGHWTSATWTHTPLSGAERDSLRKLLSSLGVQPLEVGGVTLYRIPPARLAPYLQVTALEMQQRYVRARFEALLKAAQGYLAGGGNLDSLMSQKDQALRLVPLDWFGGPAFPAVSPNKIFQVQWALGQWHPGRVAIGVEGSYEALQPLISQYGPDSIDIHCPFPQRLAAPPPATRADDSAPALMVMEFTSGGLASAAARVASSRVPP
jgi:hypothetical protein